MGRRFVGVTVMIGQPVMNMVMMKAGTSAVKNALSCDIIQSKPRGEGNLQEDRMQK